MVAQAECVQRSRHQFYIATPETIGKIQSMVLSDGQRRPKIEIDFWKITKILAQENKVLLYTFETED